MVQKAKAGLPLHPLGWKGNGRAAAKTFKLLGCSKAIGDDLGKTESATGLGQYGETVVAD